MAYPHLWRLKRTCNQRWYLVSADRESEAGFHAKPQKKELDFDGYDLSEVSVIEARDGMQPQAGLNSLFLIATLRHDVEDEQPSVGFRQFLLGHHISSRRGNS